MLDLVPQSGGIVPADPAAVAAAEAAKARIQSAYVMALQRPRNEDQARHHILQACKRPDFAARVEYAKPVGNTKIKGPSIRLAEEILRSWGNILVETTTVYDDKSVRRIQVTCLDLETNSSFGKQIQVTKTVERAKAGPDREVVGERLNSRGEKVFIVVATEDELATKEAAMISKIVRNEGLRLIPSDIVDEALKTARDTLANRDSQDPEAGKKRILDAFAGLGIQPKHLEEHLGHALDIISPAELEELRGMFQAIKDGEASWADYAALKGSATDAKQPPEGQQDAGPTEKDLFDELHTLASAKGLTGDEQIKNLDSYIAASVKHFGMTAVDLLTKALPTFEAKLWPGYLKWGGCSFKPEAPAPEPAENPGPPNNSGAEVTNAGATPEQVKALGDLLTQAGASDRYQADIPDVVAKVCPEGTAFDAARRFLDCLVVDPVEWGPFDAAMGYKPAKTATAGKGKQGSLV